MVDVASAIQIPMATASKITREPSRDRAEPTDDSRPANDIPRAVSSSSVAAEKTLTIGLLERLVKQRSKGEHAVERWIAKTTHLHLEGKFLTRLGPLMQKCVNLKYLYCYDNKLRALDHLPAKVEAIYADNNCIESLELNNLPNLRTLSARHNRIKEIDSLEAPLEELYLSGQPVSIAPHVIVCLSATLQLLTLSDCRLKSLDFLCSAGSLHIMSLDVSDNCIKVVEDAIPAFQLCAALVNLYVLGNPFCKQPKYRDSIIVAVPGPLKEIDNKLITAAEKEFLKIMVPKRRSLQKCENQALEA